MMAADKVAGGWHCWGRKTLWLGKAPGGFWVLLVGLSVDFGLFCCLPFCPL